MTLALKKVSSLRPPFKHLPIRAERLASEFDDEAENPMKTTERPVAVIDIGSNTIKILVAAQALSTNGVHTLFESTIETRLSQGLNGNGRALSGEIIEQGIQAVELLLKEAEAFSPAVVRIVATSALREARNRDVFARRVREATGHELRILSGNEEARAIARALALDPNLAAYRSYYVFDLGGGSLEGLVVRERSVESAMSLPLGAVRLMEDRVADREAPFSGTDRNGVETRVAQTLRESGFHFSMDAPVVATGGALMVARAILAVKAAIAAEDRSPVIRVEELESLLDEIGDLPLADRAAAIPELPARRADIMPAALAIFIKLASLAGVDEIVVSRFNLRYGFID